MQKIINEKLEELVDLYLNGLAWNYDCPSEEEIENAKVYERGVLLAFAKWLRMKSELGHVSTMTEGKQNKE